MKASIAAIALVLVLGPAGAGRVHAGTPEEDVTKHPGYVDFGTVNLFGKQQADVEIFLEKNLLDMVASLAKTSDPELADMLSKLKQIRVQSFAIEPDKLDAIEKKTEEMSGKLTTQGWSPIVRVRDREENSQTYVYLKWVNNKVQGLVVMSVDPKDKASSGAVGGAGSASFVNIVGEVDPEQLGKLESKFDIHGLDSLDVGGTHKHGESGKSPKKK